MEEEIPLSKSNLANQNDLMRKSLFEKSVLSDG